MPVSVAALTLAAGLAGSARVRAGGEPDFLKFLPNNFPHVNPGGISTTFSTRGFVDVTGGYFQAQGFAVTDQERADLVEFLKAL
jgi:hypothetical protein